VIFLGFLVLGVSHGSCCIEGFESPVVVVKVGKMHWEGCSSTGNTVLGVSGCGLYAAIDMGRELHDVQGWTVVYRGLVASCLLKVA